MMWKRFVRIWVSDNSIDGDYFFVGLFIGLLVAGLFVIGVSNFVDWRDREVLEAMQRIRDEYPQHPERPPADESSWDSFGGGFITGYAVFIIIVGGILFISKFWGSGGD